MQKNLLVLIGLVAALAVVIFIARSKSTPHIPTSFSECTAIKGAIVMESYPRRCRTPAGQVFTEEISPKQSILPLED